MGIIRKIAVIGGGPAGIIAANDLARQKDQDWQIVGFEARQNLGGVWSDTPGSKMESPDVFQQLRLSTADNPLTPESIFNYDSPVVENGRVVSLRSLSATSVSKPLKLVRKPLLRDGLIMSEKTGIYEELMTNVPGKLMKLSATEPDSSEKVSSQRNNPDIAPLIKLNDVKAGIDAIIEQTRSAQVFRLHTCVEYLDKLSPEKWIIIARKSEPGNDYDEWYMETFDAVIIANGHFMCPYVPYYMTPPQSDHSNIHEFNMRFPSALMHVKDLDLWYRKHLPKLQKESLNSKQKIVIVGKSFSAMDVLKRLVPLQDSGHNLEIIISTKTPPLPENKANPFCWFDQWLTETKKVEVKGPISHFLTERSTPALQFEDGTIAEQVSAVIFATGYLYTFPFISSKLLESYRVLITPDPRNNDSNPSNMSRVTGLYLHTFSIADPTMGFVGISSNATFQSFSISSRAIAGAWSKLNRLYDKEKPQDGPIYDSIWSQVLPSVQEQLKWSQERLVKTGNSAFYHFYYPLDTLFNDWLQYCKPLFSQEDQQEQLFPANSAELSKNGLKKLEELFFDKMGPERH
ncbi:LANO_0A04280g1_1 [Lachancea nothofagi CBS 11611]|uniref:LANO_0A04280g1_1 n=1 Tax=Lachancea nothofagi CBS 11611 TaxID=1266666 RepID=A0A1G4IQA2_9SACH|nr:LANO_0A04280g1_1 [Lachancea nothofagi CBS 11611]